MQITSKGQVTIPLEIRTKLGLLPHTQVEFEMAGDHAVIRKASAPSQTGSRGRMLVELLRGSSDTGMTTDEIMMLTRGRPMPRRRQK